MKRLIKELIPYIIIVIIVIIIRLFIVTPVQVSGLSMYPTLKDKEVLMLNRLSGKITSYKRNQIVVIDLNSKDPLIKRIIGLPGEHVKYRDNNLYINDKLSDDKYASLTDDFDLEELGYDKIPDDYYLVLGDNREISKDSRKLGLMKKSEIDGTILIRIWPLNKIRTIK